MSLSNHGVVDFAHPQWTIVERTQQKYQRYDEYNCHTSQHVSTLVSSISICVILSKQWFITCTNMIALYHSTVDVSRQAYCEPLWLTTSRSPGLSNMWIESHVLWGLSVSELMNTDSRVLVVWHSGEVVLVTMLNLGTLLTGTTVDELSTFAIISSLPTTGQPQ